MKTFKIKFAVGTSRQDERTYCLNETCVDFMSAARKAERIAKDYGGRVTAVTENR